MSARRSLPSWACRSCCCRGAANIAWANVWIDFCLWWVKVTCRITHRVNGLENRPAGPVILACKHQSSWETLAFHRLFPNAATVLKRELLYIPVVGWAMARAGNIAVERGDGAKALRSLLRQAKAAVAEGRSILIYPEGTRTPVGASLPYHAGTAALYRQLGVPVVPVALNSGVFWGRRKFIKWPGIDRGRGPAADPAGPGPRDLHGDPARAHRRGHPKAGGGRQAPVVGRPNRLSVLCMF